MNNLILYNTLTKRLDRIEPNKDERFTIYFCGPTVYNRAHIGNFRTYIIEDLLVRVLKLENYNPFVVRNITDVDDKTIRDSQKAKIALSTLTDKYIKYFHEDCESLNILQPDIEPRATKHINEQIQLIQSLIDNGHAYVSENSVYFQVKSFQTYGQLSNINHRTLKTQELDSAGKKNIADEYDRDNVSDFVLWKARKPEDGDNFWPSPWGDGRPGWHIECSAMSMKYLGPTIDLHAGGIDLCFPHHDNEIAQSEASTNKQFVRYWVHTAHLLVDGTKMSKSLGNIYTLQDIISRGFSAETLRYCLLSGHYKQPLNFTMNSLSAASNALKKLYTFSSQLVQYPPIVPTTWKFFGETYQALLNDLNTPLCLGNIFRTIGRITPSQLNTDSKDILSREFSTIKYALGLQLNNIQFTDIPTDIHILAQARWEAKLQKNYKLADEIRLNIESAGWIINDSRSGFTITKKS